MCMFEYMFNFQENLCRLINFFLANFVVSVFVLGGRVLFLLFFSSECNYLYSHLVGSMPLICWLTSAQSGL